MVVSGTKISRVALWAHVAVAAAVLLSTATLPALFVGDVTRYADIATGPTFWRGQEVEFPLLAAGFAWATARWGATSLLVVPLANLVLDACTAIVILRVWGARSSGLYLALSALILPISLFRLDHPSVLLAVVGLALARGTHHMTGGAVLGLAIHAKLWPAALVAAYPRDRARVAVTATVVAAVIAAGWVAVFGADAVMQVLGFRGSVGWQIESLGGSLIRLVDQGPARFEGGAWRVGAPPSWAFGALAVLGLAVFVASRRLVSIERRQLTLTLGLLLASPLLSPQFLVWLCPLVAIQADDDHRRRQSLLLGLSLVYTLVLALYYGYVIQGEWLATLALGLRNLCLVGMLVLGLQASTGVRGRGGYQSVPRRAAT